MTDSGSPREAHPGNARSSRGHPSIFSRIGRNISWDRRPCVQRGGQYRLYGDCRTHFGAGGFRRLRAGADLRPADRQPVRFQSWKGVIRYGAIHVDQNSGRTAWPGCSAITATLDIASAVVGSLLAVVTMPIIGPADPFDRAEQRTAALFGAVLLLTSGATPTGILRLFDRFDMLAYTDAIGPIVRLIGSVVGWLLVLDVRWFLFVWALAAILQATGQWFAAVVLQRAKLSLGRKAFRQTLRENRRIWRFMVMTNLSSSLSLFWLQSGTLAVGAWSPDRSGRRVPHRAPLRPRHHQAGRDHHPRALPEIARLVAEDDRRTLRNSAAGQPGRGAVRLGGRAGDRAGRLADPRTGRRQEIRVRHLFLFLLSISAAIDLAGFALEPFHNAHGRAGRVLRSDAVGAIVYVALLACSFR